MSESQPFVSELQPLRDGALCRWCSTDEVDGAVYRWRSVQMAQCTDGAVYRWRSVQMAQCTDGAVYRCCSVQMAQCPDGAVQCTDGCTSVVERSNSACQCEHPPSAPPRLARQERRQCCDQPDWLRRFRLIFSMHLFNGILKHRSEQAHLREGEQSSHKHCADP